MKGHGIWEHLTVIWYMTSYDSICQVVRIPDAGDRHLEPCAGMISYMISEDNDIDYDIIGFEITMIS
jgi:hypothetical protein